MLNFKSSIKIISYFTISKITIIFLILLTTVTNAQRKPEPLPFPDRDDWVQSKMKKMSLEEKIGQLMMVAAYSSKDEDHQKEIEAMIQSQYIGGIIFFKGSAEKQIIQTNKYQKLSNIPLFIGMDAEWGASMRLDSLINYPRQLMLGAIQDDRLIFQYGTQVAKECKRLGVNINFAPVMDINNNPNNPVIHDRSFGENIENVIRKGVMYQHALEENGVMACSKHFPGHGDTDADSHHTLPTLNHSIKRLEQVEFKPFIAAIDKGVDAIMVGHLSIPALDDDIVTDTTTGTKLARPASLSGKIINELLRKELDFNGLIITDALNMKGVANFFPPGRLEVEALKAGNDILLFPQNVTAAIRAIKEAVRTKEIKEKKLDAHVRRVLEYKYDYELYQYKPINPKNAVKDMTNIEAKLLQRKLIKNAITIAKDEKGLLPIDDLTKASIAHILLGKKQDNEFSNTLALYTAIDEYIISKETNKSEVENIMSTACNYSHIIVSLQDVNRKITENFGLDTSVINKLNKLAKTNNLIVVNFGSPYLLKFIDAQSSIVQAYENNEHSQSFAAQIIFGGMAAKGYLPVSVGKDYKFGNGIITTDTMRLRYVWPEEAGIKSAYLTAINDIANECIDKKATPGCQVLLAKDGNVFYNKSFGYHKYDKATPVQNSDIYDIASITKIAGTLPVIMKLYETGGLNLEDKLGKYFPEFGTTNKYDLTLKDLLIHQAGLVDWIPFYKETMEGKPDAHIYKNYKDEQYAMPVAKDMYMDKAYTDVIWNKIIESPVDKKPVYKYSDLPYFFFKRIIEKFYNQNLESIATKNWLKPLGMNNTMYLAAEKIPLNRIVPTENDTYYRKQLLQGYVHDMAAAMQGGIGGHAGLFSNANDLAKLMQFFLNKGHYASYQFLNPRTVELFTSTQVLGNRRGLGFDKPDFEKSSNGPTSVMASPKTFGHTGFTGTCAWADPEYNLIYIYLSNRVHPDMNNKKLQNENIRTRIMDELYKAINDPYIEAIP